MSCNISIYKNGEEICSMNWLRNPFGLVNWAYDNIGREIDTENKLWHVINDYAYDKSKNVDKKLFKEIVNLYWNVIKDLKEGYFAFGISSYIQFVEPIKDSMEKEPGWSRLIKGQKYAGHEIFIPMERFRGREYSLEHHKNWFEELVQFAEELQDEGAEYYCSN